MSLGLFKADGLGGFPIVVAGFGAMAVILTVSAALWINERTEKQALAAKSSGRVAFSQNIRSVLDDPVTTGSIASAAGAIRLDPCAGGANR